MIGSPMVDKLVEKARICTREDNIGIDRTTNIQFSPISHSVPKKVKAVENKKSETLARKTAMDVVSCIFWDDCLNANDFIMGYHDHRQGIVEEIFSTFSWTDDALIDGHKRAVPKNRIRYFKYKGITIWDKKRKIDNVFGSDGSGVTIYDVIEEYKASARFDDPEASDSDVDTEDVKVDAAEIKNVDEGVILRKRDFYWGKKDRPTHFLCIRVTNDKILNQIRETHPEITRLHPEYKDCLIPTETLHVTLASLGLDSEEQMQHAVQVLEHAQPKLQAMNPMEIQLCFDSVGINSTK